MLSQSTGQFFDKVVIQVVDLFAQRITDVYPEQEPLDVIDRTFSKRRGDKFQLWKSVQKMEVVKFAPGGTYELLSEAARAVGQPEVEVLKTWKWTGRKFVEVL